MLARALVLLVTAALAWSGGSAGADPIRPDKDPFYDYDGSQPLAKIAPGTVLRHRTISWSIGTTPTPLTAHQLLYRTTGQRDQPTVTVTTLIEPPNAAVLPRIVGYLSFYDGLGPQCDPSYFLAGGSSGDSAFDQQVVQEEMLINWYLSMGSIVTVPDFEGTRHAWMAGRESGYATLDAIRATESFLDLPSSTAVGLSGYSGGAVGGDWAAELAPTYAPDLNLVGVAIGGVPVHYGHMFEYVNGSDQFSSAIPGMLIGLSRAHGVDLVRYLSDYGQKVVGEEEDACIVSTFGDYPGLTTQKLMKAKYGDVFDVRPLVRMLNDSIMGSAPGHPRVPMFIAVGNSDGTGDGVVRADDVEALAYQYCRQGVPVRYEEYQGASHVTAGAFFNPKTGPFLQARFAGLPFQDNCSEIGSGSSLAPIALPNPNAGQGTKGERQPGDDGVADNRSLATTGSARIVPLAALALALGSLVLFGLVRAREV